MAKVTHSCCILFGYGKYTQHIVFSLAVACEGCYLGQPSKKPPNGLFYSPSAKQGYR